MTLRSDHYPTETVESVLVLVFAAAQFMVGERLYDLAVLNVARIG